MPKSLRHVQLFLKLDLMPAGNFLAHAMRMWNRRDKIWKWNELSSDIMNSILKTNNIPDIFGLLVWGSSKMGEAMQKLRLCQQPPDILIHAFMNERLYLHGLKKLLLVEMCVSTFLLLSLWQVLWVQFGEHRGCWVENYHHILSFGPFF